MSVFEAWIGSCHLREIEGYGEYHCLAAVWANGIDTFRARLAAHVETQGYSVLWAERCHPAPQYLQRHGEQQRHVGPLARAVHQGHHVELSPIAAVGSEGEAEMGNYLTITEPEFEPLAEQPGIPFWEQEWIAPELKELLFGQPEDGPEVRTYLIVDATLRKNITGVFDLDSTDVPVQCLFKGEKAEELKESAPYLIDMTLPDGAWADRDLVPAFQRDFFRKHWGRNTGIFVRSPEPMADVWRHFRKFTRIRMEDGGRWVYFRFWDPRTMSAFVETLDEEDTHKFLGQHRLINPASTTLKSYHVTDPIGDNQRRTLHPLIMKHDYIKAFGADRGSKIKTRIQAHLEKHSAEFDVLQGDRKSHVLDVLMTQAEQYGIKIERAVADFVLASVLFGRVLANDPKFERILESDHHEIDRGKTLLREVNFRMSAK